ncbi:MAG TPA: arabinofuranosidase catalytic domain-containing protein, partial [Acidobacteriaceae bacterium]|nr:arabinofuranosidase catalytic domain-containing protein [Acidobacteriaceae bacterium]
MPSRNQIGTQKGIALGTRGSRLLLQVIVAAAVYIVAARAAAVPLRSRGPCDIYGAANTPCIAAHSTTRALYAGYNGPLYQVKRDSDGRTLQIAVVPSSGSDPGGYADAAAQDAFCARTLCVITVIYDQSGNRNDLLQAPPGTFKGPAKGAFDTLPIADMAPVMISGHKVYGVFIMPGMGLRNNDANGIAIGDEPEGIYYVVDGTHFDSGCCFDYGNSSTNGRAVGTGTMETVYFGTSTIWGSGNGPGPWIMSDMEAGLFSGHDPKRNLDDPTINSWPFVTAVMDGGGGDRWDLRGGNAQHGGLTTFYDGPRPAPKTSGVYFPMRKQGGILLGTGGDNGNGSSGTFYEGVMTTGYPSLATTDAVQQNIVAAAYTARPLTVSRVTSFTPGSKQVVTATFTNTTDAPVSSVTLSLAPPSRRWSAAVPGTADKFKTFAGPIAPGATVSSAFELTAPSGTEAGLLTATAAWKGPAGAARSDTLPVRVRTVPPVRITEVRVDNAAAATGQFVELYTASAAPVDISNWILVATPSQWASTKLVTIKPGTALAAHSFYLLELAGSGLVAPAEAGASAINLWNTRDLQPGEQIDVDGETRRIATVGSGATP